MKRVKPNKGVMLYWFIDKGFFFLIASLLLIGTYLRYFTNYYALTLFILQFVIVMVVFSALLLIYEWFMTEYYLFDTHLLIKDIDNSRRVNYSEIVDVGFYGSLLQHLMGTTNIAIYTKSGEQHYLRGIREHKKIEKELLTRSTKP